MKVDIRDAAAWGKLDSALTRLAVGKRAAGQGGPQHAASAPALRGNGGGGGEEEEEDFEPLSPDSSASALAGVAEEAESPVARQQGDAAPRRGLMGGIRQHAAKKLRQLAETTAAHISRCVGGADRWVWRSLGC